MANQRKDVPAGWTWDNGKPRWIPSPAARAQGWKVTPLKTRNGIWLDRGASITQAERLAGALEAWRRGELVAAEFAHLAPDGASTTPREIASTPTDRLSIGALVDAWQESDEFKALATATRRDYAGKLKRLLDVLCGHLVLPPKGDEAGWATYRADLATLRAASIFVLEPAETQTGVTDLLHRAYWKLHDGSGLHQAHGVLTVASVWLGWCRKRQSRTIHNWAAEVSRETPPGRIRVATWPELTALVQAAERLGHHGVADALILAVDLSWSEADILNLTWDRIRDGRAWTGAEGRQKTGRVGGTPLLSLGLNRLQTIRKRQADMTVSPIKVIHLPRKRIHREMAADADSHYLRKLFAKVRAEAVKICPSCADLTFADTRDTAFTLGRNAGLSDDMTASRTLQSRKNIRTLGDRHYGEIGADIADQGRALLEDYMARNKLTL
jgi:hypothetical protein